MDTKKKPRVGLMMLIIAIGTGTAGYLLGRFDAPDAPPPRAAPTTIPFVAVGLPPADDAPDEAWLESDAAPPPAAPAGTDDVSGRKPVPTSELLDSLRRHAGTDRAQKILAGLVADAARIGGPMLPEIRGLLDSGVDLKFATNGGKGAAGFPSLRIALMAAAEATGDPAAAAIVAEVTHTTENPVEVVFGADVLSRLGALDAKTAQRTLDSLAAPLDPEQRKAMGPVLGRVVPQAATVDPAYAETLLRKQLRAEDRRNTRLIMPALNGLPPERAQELVLSAMTAGDIDDRNKRMLAGQAARRPGIEMLDQLRKAIETNTVSPRVAASVAYSAMSYRPYGAINKHVRIALKNGDVGAAKKLAADYHARLVAAQKTVTAARNAGAKLKPKLATTTKGLRQTLDELRAQISRRIKALEREAKKQGK